MSIERIVKRDGREVEFSRDKIFNAIMKAVVAVGGNNRVEVENVVDHVISLLEESGNSCPSVDDIQNAVERALVKTGHATTAKEYILYRAKRDRIRSINSSLMRTIGKFTFSDADEVEKKRENANIDGDTSMGTMLKYGSEVAKQYNLENIVSEDIALAHQSGDIHIHDLDFMGLTFTCCQLDIEKLFRGGFDTGHGFIREPNDIRSYGALACIAIQGNQNEMHREVA